MNDNIFSKAVKENFSFLITEYGYNIIQENYQPETMGNALVVFASRYTIFKIVQDRGQVLINIGEASMPRTEWFEFTDVIRFFSFDETLDVYQFSSINPYDLPPIKEQVSRLAKLTRKYCTPILEGDFSMKQKIKELEKKRTDKLFNELGKK